MNRETSMDGIVDEEIGTFEELLRNKFIGDADELIKFIYNVLL